MHPASTSENRNAIVLILAVLFLAGNCSSLPARPGSPRDARPVVEPDDDSIWTAPFLFLIRKHRQETTAMDGPRCPLYPTCSAYADKAISEYGLTGLIVFLDRLFYREFGDLSDRYLPVPRRLSRDLRYFDPVSDSLPWGDAPGPSLLLEDLRE